MTDVTQSADYAALLRGVLEEPDSDLRRLVAADWLDENGDGDRAEFIRVQIESAGAKHNHRHHRFGGRPCEACRLDRRERELWGSASLRAARLAVPVEAALCGSVGANLCPSASFSRGFASAVTLTQAVFVGGPCGACWGRGHIGEMSGPNARWCRACSGTGRTPGLAAALFAAHPITSVTLSDVGPAQSFGGWHFARWPDGFSMTLQRNETTHLIRDPLWSAELIAAPFPRPAQAYAALSRRCVQFARGLAGLPPLAAGATRPA